MPIASGWVLQDGAKVQQTGEAISRAGYPPAGTGRRCPARC